MITPAICLRPMVSTKSDLKVSPDLAKAVTKELGDSVLLGLDDERVEMLTGYFFQGLEYPGFVPARSLGEGWKEVERDMNPATKEYLLQPDPNGDRQELVLDLSNDSMRLHTGNSEPGPFEGTYDFENMWLSADGSVKRERGKAI